MPRKIKLPESPLTEELWPLTPDEELAVFLQTEYERFQSDPSHVLPALNALQYTTTAIWLKEQKYSPQDTITIPFWIADLLTKGFHL